MKLSATIRTMLTISAVGLALSGCVVAPYGPGYGSGMRGDVVIGVAPIPGFIWFDGFWSNDTHGHRHWTPGHWGAPNEHRH